MGKLGNSDITVNIHIDEIEKYTEESILKALEIIGLKAESYAKMKCPVDTGLLRNSIAHAVAGEQPSIGVNYMNTAKKACSYKADKPDDEGNIKSGTYTGHVPKKKGEYKIYVGTNVEYAPYVEMGHRQNVGQFVPKLGKRLVTPNVEPKPYIKPAFVDHMDEYEEILKNTLQEAFNDSSN